jgi:hypothetical protein
VAVRSGARRGFCVQSRSDVRGQYRRAGEGGVRRRPLARGAGCPPLLETKQTLREDKGSLLTLLETKQTLREDKGSLLTLLETKQTARGLRKPLDALRDKTDTARGLRKPLDALRDKRDCARIKEAS